MDPYGDIPKIESDMDRRPRPLMPMMAIVWVPLTIAMAAGIVFAARFGYERATSELEQRPNPASGNESTSSAFLVDPGDEPLVFAPRQKALRDHLSSPPGSTNSETVIIDKPVRLRLLRRDEDLVYVIVVEGRYQSMNFWTKKDRILAARPVGEEPEPESSDPAEDSSDKGVEGENPSPVDSADPEI